MSSIDLGILADTLDERPLGFRGALERAGLGLALSATFGAAVAARYGVTAMAAHAFGVPLGYAAVLAFGTPALCIGVAHFDLPLDAAKVVEQVSRGVAVSGLVLAGLSPAALLLSVTAESPVTAAVAASLGLALASCLGAWRVQRELGAGPRAFWFVFLPFAALLAIRVWWLALPMLGRTG